MPLLALALVLLAAILHASWNFLAKSAEDSTVYFWWVVAVGAALNLSLATLRGELMLPPAVLPILLPSLIAEVGYIYCITRGYAGGDLSQVYPIARGSAPLFIALWSAIFLQERLPLLGYVAIALLIGGVYLASLGRWGEFLRPLLALSRPPARWALLSGLCISIYTLLDRIGLQWLSPLAYNTWVYVGITIGFAPFAWGARHRRVAIATWQKHKAEVILSGAMSTASYLLALIALTITNASYVGAVRGTSVVLGALLGWLVLKERFGPVRLVAAGLMVVGLIVLAGAR